MRKRQAQPCALALRCDRSGIIVEVLYASPDLANRVVPGIPFTAVVDAASAEKATLFWDTLREQQAAFDWQLNMPSSGRVIALHFHGSATDNGFLVAGATSRPHALRLYEECIMTSNERKGRPPASSEPRRAEPGGPQSDLALFDELSRINNELVTTQRALAQKQLELEMLASENARLYTEAQEALRMQNAFLSTLTHDLKTPLSAIMGYTQLLARRIAREGTPDPAKILEGLLRIEATAGKMTEQINGLLEIARLQQGEAPPLELEPVDLVALVQKVSAELQPTARSKIAVETAVPSLVGQWDVDQLERMLTNLISNAIKYSPDGGDIRVELAMDEQTADGLARAIVRVCDQGMGIPAEDLPYIFEPFRRGRNTIGRIDGTGIGLFSVRQIVEQHGGAIAVESEEGVGTTFTIHLPLASTAVDDDAGQNPGSDLGNGASLGERGERVAERGESARSRP
ncbi:MAG: HAMP domain-containing histidine kinase [Chloroflexota bacterium]|nr:HAMP domain-containing histidine kinase [Chloroflexota bacterium]